MGARCAQQDRLGLSGVWEGLAEKRQDYQEKGPLLEQGPLRSPISAWAGWKLASKGRSRAFADAPIGPSRRPESF